MKKLLFTLCCLAAASSGHAQEAPLSEPQINLLATACANCHGVDGRGTNILQPLAGRSATLLENQLLGFKHQENTQATVMDRIAKGYSDTELKALANYFANKPAQ